jgi:steroid 5-alpha reductase family enzyme
MTEALMINAGVLVLGMAVLWRIAVGIGDVSFIDAVWGGGMGVLALVSLTQVAGRAGNRAHLIAAMATIWAARLAWHLYRRWRANGEDPRYAAMLGKARAEGRFGLAALQLVFAPQAVLLFITCLPAQLGILASGNVASVGVLAAAGAVLWMIGIAFEAVGDWQLQRFRADPENKGRVLDTGLWHYTRHPNYFGDACLWWGIWLAAAEAGPWVALVSAIGPVFLTFTLTRWSGKPLLEKDMAARRPGYAEYVRRTSGFVPWWPKQG